MTYKGGKDTGAACNKAALVSVVRMQRTENKMVKVFMVLYNAFYANF